MTGRPWVIHPFLIAPIPVLQLNANDRHAIPIGQALIPSALALAAVGSVLVGHRLARFDGPGAALAIGAGAMAAAVGVCFARPATARAPNGPVDASSVAMAGLWAFGLASSGWTEPPPPRAAERPTPAMRSVRSRRPDVYVLILDAYGRSEVLKDLFRFDKAAFLDRLEARGFFVARRSTANYCQTAPSIAATLNLSYLDDLAGSRSPSRLPLCPLIQGAAVFRASRDRGYRIVSFATGFDATERAGADSFRAPSGNLGPFATLVADRSPVRLLMGREISHRPHAIRRERIPNALDGWPRERGDRDAPVSCFAHVLAPHPPFDFGPDGRDTSGREGSYTLNDSEGWRRVAERGESEEHGARYRARAIYITARVEEAVGRILAGHGPGDRPIIVIQGDHGPGSHFDSGSGRPNDLRERRGTLNAVYLPDGPGVLDEAITPVNTFRIILGHAFGTGLRRLADRDFDSPYDMP